MQEGGLPGELQAGHEEPVLVADSGLVCQCFINLLRIQHPMFHINVVILFSLLAIFH